MRKLRGTVAVAAMAAMLTLGAPKPASAVYCSPVAQVACKALCAVAQKLGRHCLMG